MVQEQPGAHDRIVGLNQIDKAIVLTSPLLERALDRSLIVERLVKSGNYILGFRPKLEVMIWVDLASM